MDHDITRAEHMAWCKQRALEELDASGTTAALASFCSDVCKHPETQDLAQFAVLLGAEARDVAEMRRFIEGFA